MTTGRLHLPGKIVRYDQKLQNNSLNPEANKTLKKGFMKSKLQRPSRTTRHFFLLDPDESKSWIRRFSPDTSDMVQQSYWLTNDSNGNTGIFNKKLSSKITYSVHTARDRPDTHMHTHTQTQLVQLFSLDLIFLSKMDWPSGSPIVI